LETGFAVAAVLVAQQLEPSLSVPTQQVRTEQPFASAVECCDRSAVNDRGSYLGMSLLQDPDGNRHPSQHIAVPEAWTSRCRRTAAWISSPQKQRAFRAKTFSWCFVIFLLRRISKHVIFHSVEMKDKVTQLTFSRKQLLQQLPDLSTILPGSLLSRMVRCNKPGCRFCEKGKGKGHGPIWILSVNLGNRQVRQIPVPNELRKEVEESLRAFAQTQKVLKQIAQLNLELFKERKRQRR